MNLLFVDCETGGLDPHTHSLLQVGMVHWSSKSAVLDTVMFNIVNRVYCVQPEALKVNGIDLATHGKDDQFAGNTQFIASEIQNWLMSRRNVLLPVMLAGWNIAFDAEFIKCHLFPDTFGQLFHHRMFDVQTLAQMMVLLQLHKPEEMSGLTAALKTYNIHRDEPHNALSCARTTMKLCTAFINKLDNYIIV